MAEPSLGEPRSPDHVLVAARDSMDLAVRRGFDYRPAMRSALGLSLLLCLVGCGKAHRPSKGFVAQEMDCKRSGLTLSEVFEETWTGEDGVMRVRYRVGASCSKPKNGPVEPRDAWQECRWSGGSWDCGDWQTGTPGGMDRPAADYLNVEKRGR